jgi:hypothetical protein
MTKARAVTEMDFRMPEFRDAKTEDYEFRDDGKIVRKDRWERGVRSVASAVGFTGRREWEIEDVVERVREIAVKEEGWLPFGKVDWRDVKITERVDVRLEDGSVLCGAVHEGNGNLSWYGRPVTIGVFSVRIL